MVAIRQFGPLVEDPGELHAKVLANRCQHWLDLCHHRTVKLLFAVSRIAQIIECSLPLCGAEGRNDMVKHCEHTIWLADRLQAVRAQLLDARREESHTVLALLEAQDHTDLCLITRDLDTFTLFQFQRPKLWHVYDFTDLLELLLDLFVLAFQSPQLVLKPLKLYMFGFEHWVQQGAQLCIPLGLKLHVVPAGILHLGQV
mmetsp:Transcript_90553/g.264999  ORF Transcript_90553/g.264999 Transcript_90553/m.264999 type:complete len:200 (-) Transcript_90553:137-736(-)